MVPKTITCKLQLLLTVWTEEITSSKKHFILKKILMYGFKFLGKHCAVLLEVWKSRLIVMKHLPMLLCWLPRMSLKRLKLSESQLCILRWEQLVSLYFIYFFYSNWWGYFHCYDENNTEPWPALLNIQPEFLYIDDFLFSYFRW